MNRFAFISFWRSLTRHKLYAALNIGGLALGIAVFVMLTLYVRFETSYEQWLPDHEQIYMVVPHQKSDPPGADRRSSPPAALAAIMTDLPGTVGTRVYTRDAAVIKNGIGVKELVADVDPAFFDIFRLPVVQGTLPRRFVDPSAIVITRRTAIKYFGTERAIGRTLPIAIANKQTNYRVASVIADLPHNTELDYDLFAPLVVTQDRSNPDYVPLHQWNYNHAQTYVRLPDAEAAARLQAQLPGVSKRHAQAESPDQTDFEVDLLLRRFDGMHLHTAGAKLMIGTLAIVGTLTLALAIVNYINLATARGGLRAREVAMRKVLGASRIVLLRHFIGEAVVTALIAAAIGLALAELGVPLLNAAVGLDLSIRYFGADGVLLPLLALAFAIGAVAGIYPAVILSRIPAAAVLAASRSPGGGRAGSRIREGLVVFQFAITIALIVGTMVLAVQTWHVRNADVGYDRQQLLLVKSFGSDSLDQAQRDTILHRFAAVPGARGVSVSETVPGVGWFTSSTSLSAPGVPGDGPMVERFDVWPGFFDVMGARVIAGRVFDPSRAADVNPNTNLTASDLAATPGNPDPRANAYARMANIVINRTAVNAFHLGSPQNAIGKVIGASGGSPRTVIGVIDDLRINSPRNAVQPTVYQFSIRNRTQTVALIRFAGDAKTFVEAARTAWRGTAPQVPFDASTAVQKLDKFYKADDRMANLFAIGSVLAVAIGCVGLWGLASFTTARRVREIGIRKTLGASSRDIVRLLVGQFLRPVLIANLFAWPLAFVAMRTWLAGFNDRIDLSPLFFVGASVLAIVIALVTVLSQSLRASRATPAWALRHE